MNIHTAAFGGGEIRGQAVFPPIGVPCPGDFDGNGAVDLNDLANLLAHFGGPANACQGDMDGNGIIDLTDLAQLLARFGAIC
jgi:hypothetical protein